MRLRKLSDGTHNLCIHHPGDVDIDDVEITPKFTLIENLSRSDLDTLQDQINAVLRGETVMAENSVSRESRIE